MGAMGKYEPQPDPAGQFRQCIGTVLAGGVQCLPHTRRHGMGPDGGLLKRRTWGGGGSYVGVVLPWVHDPADATDGAGDT